MDLLDAIKESRNKKANFKQTFDIIINLRNVDLKRPENRIKLDVNLPKGLGKPIKSVIIADILLPYTKDLENVIVIKRGDLENYDKKKTKHLNPQHIKNSLSLRRK